MLENKSRLKRISILGYKSLGSGTQPVELELYEFSLVKAVNDI